MKERIIKIDPYRTGEKKDLCAAKVSGKCFRVGAEIRFPPKALESLPNETEETAATITGINRRKQLVRVQYPIGKQYISETFKYVFEEE